MPRARPGGPGVSLPSTVAPRGAEKIVLKIRGVHIVGSTVYSPEELAPLYQDLVGQRVPLTAVYEIARRITAKYGADGYVLSRAIVPPQNLSPGGAVIKIQVIEGYVDRVIWPPQVARYRDFFTDYAAKITADRPANIRTLERYLLLASDLPGLKFRTSLKPSSKHSGASTLFVEVDEKAVDAFIRADNRTPVGRGPLEFMASVSANNLLGHHEQLTATWAASVPEYKQMEYYYLGYRQVISSEGLTFFANASYGKGLPGIAPLQALSYNSRSTIFEMGMAYPVIRARERNLTLSGLYFMSNSESETLGQPFTDDRIRGFRLKADADWADPIGGINMVNLTFSQGINGLDGTGNGNPLASRLVGHADFSKVEAVVSHLQPLIPQFSLLLSAYTQFAFTPLLSPEQCGYGGRVFGRAFDPFQYAGDHCWEALAELRYDVPGLGHALPLAQIYGYTDYGKVYNLAASPGTPNGLDGASAGAGVRVGWPKHFTVDLSAAKAIEGVRNDWRFFFIAGARY